MDFEVGDTIGDYRILGLLGQGGMGSVYRVENLISERVEAMKVVLPGLEDDPDLADRFLREIRVHSRLDHPNIAALRTAFRAGDRIVMILELVEGASLSQIIAQGAAEPGVAVDYMDQVLSALAYAHRNGVVHRDIKPANIIVSAAGIAKLTDFGIAWSGAGRRLTQTGMAVGSLHYMSPEQIRAETVDARSDLYSLGITFYELVTGRHPIPGDGQHTVMYAQLNSVPAAPSELNPAVPPELSAAIMKAIEKDPANRFDSAEAFQAALPGSRRGTPHPPAIPAVAAVEPEVLAAIEANLLSALGPIARHLVAREARRHSTAGELCRALAAEIPQERQRTSFLRSCARSTTANRASAPTKAIATQQPVWDDALLEEVTRKLAAHIGPIAKVVVRKAAARVRTQDELRAALAAEIPSERGRTAFLRALGT